MWGLSHFQNQHNVFLKIFEPRTYTEKEKKKLKKLIDNSWTSFKHFGPKNNQCKIVYRVNSNSATRMRNPFYTHYKDKED